MNKRTQAGKIIPQEIIQDKIEEKYDYQFKIVFDTAKHLIDPPQPPKKRIGFHTEKK